MFHGYHCAKLAPLVQNNRQTLCLCFASLRFNLVCSLGLVTGTSDQKSIPVAPHLNYKNNDGDGVVLGELALCEDTAKELFADGELKQDVIF